jgi:heat-inducible transcriptional repressor
MHHLEGGSMLSDRQHRILSALIEEYVAHAMPVGSRTIAEQYHLGVSPATVRNELAALEDAGYIVQPHTSAGRIPTDAGYRRFVDGLLANEQIAASASKREAAAMRQSADALDDLMDRISVELARLTKCLSIVVPPAKTTSSIRQVSFVMLGPCQAIAVIVLSDGDVLNGQIVSQYTIDSAFLSVLQARMCELFVDKTVPEALELCELALRDPLAFSDAFASKFAQDALGCIERTLGNVRHSSRPSSMGMSALMSYPEFHDSSSLLPVLELLEDDTVLFRTVDATGAPGDVTVCIGEENPDATLRGVSVIAGMYGQGPGRGIVAVIGPKRMDYSRVIGAVRVAQDVLKGR